MVSVDSSSIIDGGAKISSPILDVEVEGEVESTATESFESFEPQKTLNLDQGDPTMYVPFWQNLGDEFNITISGSQSLSYFANPESFCWFLMPQLEEEIKNLHNLVGNAVVSDHHIVVGNGSSQLIQAALYALAEPLNQPDPVSVVSAAPFYSCYPQIADFVRSGLFKWGGDANVYEGEGAYIELITSPNNPDGEIREAVVNRDNGMLIHDLAYYWPQYTPITTPLAHEVMLFTLSKCTGHAGSRIGWALVKNEDVAKKMVKFIEVNTIGVSKESQLRAAAILAKISQSCNGDENNGGLNNFFELGKLILAKRWKKLREALQETELLHVPNFPLGYCNFSRELTEAYPAYAWIQCREGFNLVKILSDCRIRARGGAFFGFGDEFARVSMIGKQEDFDSFVARLPLILKLLAINGK